MIKRTTTGSDHGVRAGAAVRRSAGLAGLLMALMLFSASATTRAAGFQLNEISVKPLGMGNAVTAIADQPWAIALNPAGLVEQRGLGLEVNVNMIAPRLGYNTTVPATGEAIRADAERHYYFFPSVFASYRLHERVAAGIGVYAPFGLEVHWGDTVGNGVPWFGRSLIEDIEVQTIYINPTVAFKLHDRVSIGAGFIIAQGSVSLGRAITSTADPADDIKVKLSGQDTGFGATAGLLVKLIPRRLNFGFNYRSAVRMMYEGDAAFTKDGSGANIPAGIRSTLVDGRVQAPLKLPHFLSFGLAAFPTDRLTLGFSVDVTTWSTYKQLEIRFLDNPELNSSEPKRWKDSYALRFGGEYHLLADNLPLRFGFVYDKSPVPNTTVGPELPDASRYVIATGLGYTWAGITAGLAYQFLFSTKESTAATAPLVGKREAKAHIATLGLSYNFAP